MSAMTNYLENAFGNHVLRNTAMTSPATVYAACHTGDPGEAGSANEVSTSGTGYVRKAVAFGAPSDGVFTQSGDTTFDVATADWGTLTHWSVWDAASGGNCLYKGALTASKLIETGDTFKYPSGSGGIVITHQ